MFEGVDEDAGEMPGIARVAIPDRVWHMGERPAHFAFDGVGGQERLGIHRIHVIDPVQQVVSSPLARRARAMTSRLTGPRRLPTCTVPEGVFDR